MRPRIIYSGLAERSRRCDVHVFKQHGANVIETEHRVHALLPQGAAIGAAVDQGHHGGQSHHHYQGGGADVELTLLLTIALVMMVIFLFLRTVWATSYRA